MRILPADVSGYPIKLPSLASVVSITKPLTPEYCDRIKDEVLKAKSGGSGIYAPDGKESLDTTLRSSSFCYLPDDIIVDVSKVVTQNVWKETVSKLYQYRKIELCEPIQFLKYDEVNNGHFRSHSDSAYFDSGGVFQYTSPRRIFTSISYLNDDFEGGELVLNSIVDDAGNPITIKPEKGMMIVFPSDVRFMHEVKPVLKGVRCAIVAWFNAFEMFTNKAKQ